VACGVGVTVAGAAGVRGGVVRRSGTVMAAVEEWRAGAAAKVIDAADEQGEPEHDDEQLDQLYITLHRVARLAIAHASVYSSGSAAAGYIVRQPLHPATARAAHGPDGLRVALGPRASAARQTKTRACPEPNRCVSALLLLLLVGHQYRLGVTPLYGLRRDICEVLVLPSIWTG
jgi:hypothetical protein